MPRYLLKPDRDEDYYVQWYTVVEASTWHGTRAEALALYSHNPEAVQRADDTGTSAFDPKFYGYGDEGMIFDQYYWLPRRNLAAVTRLLHQGVVDDDPRLQALLENLDDRLDVFRLGLVIDEDES